MRSAQWLASTAASSPGENQVARNDSATSRPSRTMFTIWASGNSAWTTSKLCT